MSDRFEKCPNCGGVVEFAADGRSARCPYCGVAEARAIDPTRLAASLRSESRGSSQLFENLATTLSQQFPDVTEVERSGGLFQRKRIEAFAITLGTSVFRMRRTTGGVTAERAEIVRGIVVRTETLPAETWVEALSADLATHAGSSGRTFEALRRLTGG
jgi:hypothetical protein